MNSPVETIFSRVSDQLIAYLPNLLAGIALIAVGWLLGWIAKRIVIQVLAVLRFDRLFRRFKWGSALGRADVRFAFLEFVGNFTFVIVFLILINAALEALQLTALSDVLERGVFFIPKLLLSAAILGLGWLLSGWIAGSVQRALVREEVPRATLIARFSKAVSMIFFSAMALTGLDFAREIVVIGFSITIATLGCLSVVLAAVSGKSFIAKMLESPDE